ncbi:hypothetical protein D3C76_1805470 [compost metagenome]
MTKASTTTSSRKSAETIFTGFSMARAKPGNSLRRSMPIATGPRTMANTCTTLANCSGMA